MSRRGAEWYKREPRAFLEGVRRLTEREIAVYAVVLDLIYDGGHQTYYDPKHIASYFSDLGAAAVRKAIDSLIDAGKLIREGEFLTNKRARNEGKTREELSKTREKAGRLGGVSSGDSRSKVKENNGLTEAKSPYTRAIDKIREDIEEEEPNGCMSETSSDAVSKRLEKKTYPDDFEAFWRDYPRTPNMSKKTAFAGWGKLTLADRQRCLAGVVPYRAFLASKADHPTMHAATFINERRFEGFADAARASTEVTDDVWQKRLTFGRKKKQWHVATWGSIPGAADCQVPQHLLQPDDGRDWAEWKE